MDINRQKMENDLIIEKEVELDQEITEKQEGNLEKEDLEKEDLEKEDEKEKKDK
ncbi:hypothetical protein [Helcococcus ovis]|uniref:hypothetical protein n=1 Tax=Helcococcus ovis TaxID=72026 RepID=UPI00142FF993|nr:hypothetical protein [Helcococcus ovis]WNZ01079.1 hypothetical protein EQF90_007370 [Helcococcus ovis]